MNKNYFLSDTIRNFISLFQKNERTYAKFSDAKRRLHINTLVESSMAGGQGPLNFQTQKRNYSKGFPAVNAL